MSSPFLSVEACQICQILCALFCPPLSVVAQLAAQLLIWNQKQNQTPLLRYIRFAARLRHPRKIRRCRGVFHSLR